jgi:hypothetical protein
MYELVIFNNPFKGKGGNINVANQINVLFYFILFYFIYLMIKRIGKVKYDVFTDNDYDYSLELKKMIYSLLSKVLLINLVILIIYVFIICFFNKEIIKKKMKN